MGRRVTVKVDWLNATFPKPALSVDGFLGMFKKLFGRPVTGEEGRGLFGFQTGVKLRAYLGGAMVDIGALAYGGESQRGRWMVQFTGKGCGLVEDWAGMREFLEGLQSKITRVDLAADFMGGEYTVNDAERLFLEGGFNGGGRRPTSEKAGDWIEGIRGRTVYVGKGTNGKMLRVYEKGKQLGDLTSPWVRWEVQLAARDRVIPFDALTEPEGYFAGCYPCLATMVDEAAEKIATVRTEGDISLAHLLFHAKRAYGKLFDLLGKSKGASTHELIEEVRIIGIPRRVNPSGVAAGVSWSDVRDQFHRKEKQ